MTAIEGIGESRLGAFLESRLRERSLVVAKQIAVRAAFDDQAFGGIEIQPDGLYIATRASFIPTIIKLSLDLSSIIWTKKLIGGVVGKPIVSGTSIHALNSPGASPGSTYILRVPTGSSLSGSGSRFTHVINTHTFFCPTSNDLGNVVRSENGTNFFDNYAYSHVSTTWPGTRFDLGFAKYPSYYHRGASGSGYYTGIGGSPLKVSIFKETSGTVDWAKTLPETALTAQSAACFELSGHVFVAFTRNSSPRATVVYCLDAGTGALVWSQIIDSIQTVSDSVTEKHESIVASVAGVALSLLTTTLNSWVVVVLSVTDGSLITAVQMTAESGTLVRNRCINRSADTIYSAGFTQLPGPNVEIQMLSLVNDAESNISPTITDNGAASVTGFTVTPSAAPALSGITLDETFTATSPAYTIEDTNHTL